MGLVVELELELGLDDLVVESSGVLSFSVDEEDESLSEDDDEDVIVVLSSSASIPSNLVTVDVEDLFGFLTSKPIIEKY